jgi:hypothetical protein
MNPFYALPSRRLRRPGSFRGPRPYDTRRERRQASIGLWLPLTPLFLLLAPFALVAAPLARLHPRLRAREAWKSVWAVGALLLSLSGTRIAVDTPAARIRIQIL